VTAAYSGIGFDDVAGTATGNFSGDRWLVSSGLTGFYKVLGFDIEPSAKIYGLWENENAYTDSLGTAQGARQFVTGRSSEGLQIAYSIAGTSGITVMPYVGLYGDYYFNNENAPAIAGAVPLASTPILSGWVGPRHHRPQHAPSQRPCHNGRSRIRRHRQQYPNLDLPRPRQHPILRSSSPHGWSVWCQKTQRLRSK
jgi:hypothetical protein